MYEDQTFDVILQRMLSRVPETMDKRESSPIYAALAPAAVELTSMYIAFDCMLAETFGDTASREYLIRLCADRGITPKKATQAVLELETDVEVTDGKRFTGGEKSHQMSDLHTLHVHLLLNLCISIFRVRGKFSDQRFSVHFKLKIIYRVYPVILCQSLRNPPFHFHHDIIHRLTDQILQFHTIVP